MKVELTQIQTGEHEQVLRVQDADSGLTGIIAIHSTQLGPAAGGLRMRAYPNEAAAMEDALRLSRGMTFKNAAAGLPLGGGKAVIIGDPARDKSPALLSAFGHAVEELGGRYWTAEDMGMTPDDMARIGSETRFVAGLADGPFASGDPSPVTARGIINVATEIQRIADRPVWVAEKLEELDATMDRTLTRARQREVSPNDVAEEIVAERLRRHVA